MAMFDASVNRRSGASRYGCTKRVEVTRAFRQAKKASRAVSVHVSGPSFFYRRGNDVQRCL